MAPMLGMLVAAAALQAVASRWLPTPWLMPDLLLLALASTALRAADRVAAASLTAAMLAVVFGGGSAVAALAYAAAGAGLAWMRHVGDTSEPVLQRVMIASAEAVILGAGAAAVGAPISAGLVWWAAVRIAVTVGCWPWVDTRLAAWIRA